MPTIITRGAMTASGYGYGAAITPVYVEDVFSTYLYTGTGAAQTITNGIDLSTKGGMVWLKDRTQANPAFIMDTTRGTSSTLQPSTTGAAGAISTAITAFNTTGFTIGINSNINTNTNNYVGWTFRKQPKFFDIVTYTGSGANRTISHNLGSIPGCIIIKRTDTTAAWAVYHRSLANTQYLVLNTTAAAATGATYWNSTTPTSSVFSLGTSTDVNALNGTYVAYIFAHDAGGFGVSGADNVISCGSFTTDASGNATINLGYEPQWVLVKPSSTTESWYIVDNMRGLSVGAGVQNDNVLVPNTAAAETGRPLIEPTSTGFLLAPGGWLPTSATMIYIAIRRGPMKTPTSGTSVYNAIARNGTGGIAQITGLGFTPDLVIPTYRSTAFSNYGKNWIDRLRGYNQSLSSVGTATETTSTNGITALGIDGWSVGADDNVIAANAFTQSAINWAFKRAPGFFDVVCYTGTGAATAFSHNLTVLPELMIWKSRSVTQRWDVWHKDLGIYAGDSYRGLLLNTNAAVQNSGVVKTSTLTSTSWTAPAGGETNTLNVTQVMYLFATLTGVSKVGSYTGTGTTLQINCGFSAGARFIMIKRTDSTGDWYVWDTVRGIIALNDPYTLMNTTGAEVTNTDYIDTYSPGFEISSTAPAAINALNGTYIFLAIA
jgi:hypothetical protein